MYAHPNNRPHLDEIIIQTDVLEYIHKRGCDFRICTSCGGPILLPVKMKSPKPTDLQINAGEYTIFVSIHQARYLHSIHMGMVPLFFDENIE